MAAKKSPNLKEKTVAEEDASDKVVSNEAQKQITLLRDENNLIRGIDYSLDDFGRIDWKKHINPDHLSLNHERLRFRNADISKITKEEILALPVEDQLVLLQGFKDLADFRGHKSYSEEVRYHKGQYLEIAVATVTISWLGIPETNMEPISLTTTGEAHFRNTNGFGQNYLARIACNRGLIANVRQICRIPIYGKDELGGDQSSGSSSFDEGHVLPYKIIENYFTKNNKTFADMKEKILSKYPEIKNGFNSWKDLEKFPEVQNKILKALNEKG